MLFLCFSDGLNCSRSLSCGWQRNGRIETESSDFDSVLLTRNMYEIYDSTENANIFYDSVRFYIEMKKEKS